jgi:hypothetical protein
MLAVIGLAIIILWLLGYLAFHLTLGLIHILPIIGLVLISMHSCAVKVRQPERF